MQLGTNVPLCQEANEQLQAQYPTGDWTELIPIAFFKGKGPVRFGLLKADRTNKEDGRFL
jgi:hypothetical protein